MLCKILIKTLFFSFMKIHLKISSAKWRPFCPGGDELTHEEALCGAWNNTIIHVQKINYGDVTNSRTIGNVALRCIVLPHMTKIKRVLDKRHKQPWELYSQFCFQQSNSHKCPSPPKQVSFVFNSRTATSALLHQNKYLREDKFGGTYLIVKISTQPHHWGKNEILYEIVGHMSLGC